MPSTKSSTKEMLHKIDVLCPSFHLEFNGHTPCEFLLHSKTVKLYPIYKAFHKFL